MAVSCKLTFPLAFKFLDSEEFQFLVFWWIPAGFGRYVYLGNGFSLSFPGFFNKRDRRKGMGREDAAFLSSTSISLASVNKKLDPRDTGKWGCVLARYTRIQHGFCNSVLSKHRWKLSGMCLARIWLEKWLVQCFGTSWLWCLWQGTRGVRIVC